MEKQKNLHIHVTIGDEDVVKQNHVTKDYIERLGRDFLNNAEAWEQAWCEHDWEIQSDECDFGCCKKK